MKTLNQPRRCMRPPPEVDDMPAACAWCKKKVGRGVVFTRGFDLGKPAVVCPSCLTPPAITDRPAELTAAE